MLVKICGLRTPAAIAAAVEAGADAIGLVLARSPRRVSAEEAEALLAVVPPGVLRVAVFRAAEPALLAAIARLPFDVIQADAASLEGADIGERAAWPVFRDGDDLRDRIRAHHHGEGLILVDGPVGGGAGVPARLERVAGVAAQRPLILAGGLTPESVGAAVRAVRPAGVDVSSGVERAPGDKDPARVRAFVSAARAAALECR